MTAALKDRRTGTLREPPGEALLQRLWRALLACPAGVFAVLSIFFGLLVAFLTPPLRGPDEPAHVLRVYGFAQGDLLPAERVGGRLGLRLPGALHDDFAFYADRRWLGEAGHDYRGVLAERLAQRDARLSALDGGPPVFVPYEGSEGYSPAAYLPYIAVAFAARELQLDFLVTLYLMRIAGLLATTALAAYAIASAPRLNWCFLVIALWPAALYGRAVVSADGAALSFAMLVSALSLRAALSCDFGRGAERALWLALGALAKPPNLALLLLEFLGARWREGRDWLRRIAVILPALVLAPLWAGLTSCELAAWRLTESGRASPQELDPVWKFGFILAHPLQFPAALLGSFAERPGELWRQLVGVLGWLDTPLREPFYPLLTALLVVAAMTSLSPDRRVRAQLALIAALTVLGYLVCVSLILFLAWTPVDATTVWGVQGRYLVPALPAAAILFAALANARPRPSTPAAAALFGGLVSGAATVDAIVRLHWS